MWIFLFIAVLVGGLMPIQARINAQLATWMKHPIHAAFISFLGGTLVLGMYSLTLRVAWTPMNRMAQMPLHLWIGGLLGAIFVSTAIYLVPKIGTASLLASAITGQLLIAIFIDHFGIFSVPIHSLSIMRFVGIALLFSGVYLIQKF